MRAHLPPDPTPLRQPTQPIVTAGRTGRVLSALWLVAVIGLAAVTGANAIFVKHASTRDRQLRSYRTGQLRQADGVEEIIPRQFEPVHDALSDLVRVDLPRTDRLLVRDTDERITPRQAEEPRAALLAANETPTRSFARTDGTLVFLPEPRFPAARPYTPHRGRAPPLAAR
jgi:hypothetical protein